jgi:two-component system, NarL family, invasion response regulator UvrY
MASPITVLAVDDRAVFLRAARELIAATPGFEQVGEAESGVEAVQLAADLRPDLALVDVRMPDMDGIETARRLHACDPDMVVVLISLDEISDMPSGDAAGVAACVRKQELSTRTLQALWERHGQSRASG